ncbi:hypothetical protein [Peribacillus acanthi]|uniref:immunity protein Imm33 domain-containing protein n=1 Tax=Peribacillus acanthi TaxID=2171554 RepID=UPI000D3EAFA4|nr:hypothetical protein [Peribacillus acanthi]
MTNTTIQQKQICEKFGADFYPADENLKLGISNNVKGDLMPINGLRLVPDEGTTGWFIWAGEELIDDPDFFLPIHTVHLNDWVDDIKKYLGLAPGWRFLIAGDYVDVWFDEELLK